MSGMQNLGNESITGNKGEWSEFYVLLRLLADGRLYAADKDINKIPDSFFDILQILRVENDNLLRTYKIEDKQKNVVLYVNGDKRNTISRKDLDVEAQYLLSKIQNGGRGAFPIGRADEIMDTLECKTIKAKRTNKADIHMVVHDSFSGLETKVGFSIKSKLGAPPTLLNASPATNFRYALPDVKTDEDAAAINVIQTRNKIQDRVRAAGQMIPKGCNNETFRDNLMLVDSRMPEIAGWMLLLSYQNNITECFRLAAMLEERNPLGYVVEQKTRKRNRPSIYTYKIKKLLAAFALGMMPSDPWSGIEEASGGYIIVKTDGDVVAYHLYNRNEFESYLFNNTRLERGSTNKHCYASVYKNTDDDGGYCMNLNMQIRFM